MCCHFTSMAQSLSIQALYQKWPLQHLLITDHTYRAIVAGFGSDVPAAAVLDILQCLAHTLQKLHTRLQLHTLAHITSHYQLVFTATSQEWRQTHCALFIAAFEPTLTTHMVRVFLNRHLSHIRECLQHDSPRSVGAHL